jgi:hypothetical protein
VGHFVSLIMLHSNRDSGCVLKIRAKKIKKSLSFRHIDRDKGEFTMVGESLIIRIITLGI